MNPLTHDNPRVDRAAQYAAAIARHRELRNAAARAGWQRRCLAFSLSDRDRREVLRNGLDEGAKRQAREDFKRLSRKT